MVRRLERMSLADQDRSSTIKVRSRKGTLRRLPHTSPSSLLSYPRTYLIILLAVPTPLAHVACDSRLGPRSSPCRLDAIVLQVLATLPLSGPASRFQGGLKSAAYHHLTADRPADLQGRNKLIQPMHRLLSTYSRLFSPNGGVEWSALSRGISPFHAF